MRNDLIAVFGLLVNLHSASKIDLLASKSQIPNRVGFEITKLLYFARKYCYFFAGSKFAALQPPRHCSLFRPLLWGEISCFLELYVAVCCFYHMLSLLYSKTILSEFDVVCHYVRCEKNLQGQPPPSLVCLKSSYLGIQPSSLPAALLYQTINYRQNIVIRFTPHGSN